MIKGIGVDNIELARIEAVSERREGFPSRVLTAAELAVFSGLSGGRRTEYLAGRWAAKEAFSKAMGTGIGPVGFQDLEVLNDELGAPYFSKSPFEGRVHVTISHSNLEAIAFIILEES